MTKPEEPRWRDAAAGEVWLLTISGSEYVATREYSGSFRTVVPTLLSASDDRITAGRRIWPEGVSGD